MGRSAPQACASELRLGDEALEGEAVRVLVDLVSVRGRGRGRARVRVSVRVRVRVRVRLWLVGVRVRDRVGFGVDRARIRVRRVLANLCDHLQACEHLG